MSHSRSVSVDPKDAKKTSLAVSTVFLASRFEEFCELRAELKAKIDRFRSSSLRLTAIDLNDGRASVCSTLDECLRQVRSAEFLILLLGTSYGPPAPDHDKSFTHLEFEEAIRDASGTRVLAFELGSTSRDPNGDSPDQRLKAFHATVSRTLRVGSLDPGLSARALAEHVFECLYEALYAKRFGELSDDSEALPKELEGAASEALSEEAEVALLESRSAIGRTMSLADEDDTLSDQLEILKNPAAVAALEQRREAERAIELRDHGTAIRHLRRALDFRPLDIKSNYWLALLYVALDRRDFLVDARQKAETAARAAAHEGSTIQAARCWVLAAQAARMSDQLDTGLELAQRAVDIAPAHAFTHLELARVLVASRQEEKGCAAVSRALKLWPRSLREAWSDPALRPIRGKIEALAKSYKQQVSDALTDLIDLEERVGGGVACPSHRPRGDESIVQLFALGHASVRRQAKILSVRIHETATLTDSNHARESREGTDFSWDSAKALADREKQYAQARLNAARSQIFGALFALALVGAYVMLSDLSGYSLAWGSLATSLVGWRGFRRSVLAERQCAAAAHRTAALSELGMLQQRTREAILTFRQTALRGMFRAAFKSPFRACANDIVRLEPTRVDWLEVRLKRQVTLLRNLPNWAVDSGADEPPELFMVTSATKGALVLDEYAAWLRL